MNRLLQIVILTIFLIPVEMKAGSQATDPQKTAPTVQSKPTYDVLLKEDIVYAQGLSHESPHSSQSTIMLLKLDVYQPANESKNRPVYLFIHGGGFAGGTKQQERIKTLADFYTSRGWVFISADYRLKKNKGTVPQEWIDYSVNLPKEKVRQYLAIYPAIRDAKAALRWVVANAQEYGINTDFITIGGGSAGAVTAVTIGISRPEDYRDELTLDQDPTLASTNLDQTYEVRTIVDFWGSKIGLDILNEVYGHQRFDGNAPSLFIAHGTKDPTVPFKKAKDLKAIYEANDLPLAYYPLKDKGHGAWGASVDGKKLEELAFKFIVEQQSLIVE